MARSFRGTNSVAAANVSFGNIAKSCGGWARQEVALAGTPRLMGSSGAQIINVQLNATSGIVLQLTHATTNGTWTVTSANHGLNLFKWYFWAWTHDGNVANQPILYVAQMGDRALRTPTVTTSTAPVGAATTDTAVAVQIGNTSGGTAPQNGAAAFAWTADRVVSSAELLNCLNFTRSGFPTGALTGAWKCSGRSPEEDMSGAGHNGTVTGSTIVGDPDLLPTAGSPTSFYFNAGRRPGGMDSISGRGEFELNIVEILAANVTFNAVVGTMTLGQATAVAAMAIQDTADPMTLSTAAATPVAAVTIQDTADLMTLSQGAAAAAEIVTSPANTATLSQAAASLVQTYLASPAMLMTLSQATPTKAQSISAGTASLMTLSQATPTWAAFILTGASLLTLSQAASTLVSDAVVNAAVSTMTLGQAQPTWLETFAAPVGTVTLSQGAASVAESFQSPSNTITLGLVNPTLLSSVTAVAGSATLSTAAPTTAQSLTSPAALLTLGAAGVTLDFGSVSFNAPNNTMTLDMGNGTSVDLGGGGGAGDHGNIAWYILDRRRRENS